MCTLCDLFWLGSWQATTHALSLSAELRGFAQVSLSLSLCVCVCVCVCVFLCFSLSLSFSLSLFLSFSLFHSFTLPLFLSFSRSLFLSLSLSVSLSHTHKHTHSLTHEQQKPQVGIVDCATDARLCYLSHTHTLSLSHPRTTKTTGGHCRLRNRRQTVLHAPGHAARIKRRAALFPERLQGLSRCAVCGRAHCGWGFFSFFLFSFLFWVCFPFCSLLFLVFLMRV